MRAETRHAILWTAALALLFFWFFSVAVRSFIDSEHQVTIYTHKFCPTPPGAR